MADQSAEVRTTTGTGGSPSEGHQFERSMGLMSNFALGFTYLSPLVGVYALFAFALTVGGPPAMWWIVIVAGGQMLVALVFGEIVSQYPITGGLYPWARRLWGRRFAWMVAWIYLAALVVTITSVAAFSVSFSASLFGFGLTAGTGLVATVAILLLALVFNLSGTRTLATVARIGFWCELVGVVAIGLFLLLFRRVNDVGVLFDSLGAGSGSYLGAFLLAALTGLYMFYGFEACGDVAEEVEHPETQIPKAMVLTIAVGAASAVLSFAGYLLAAPNLQAIVDGEIADPIPAILEATLGSVGAKVFLVVALIAFISCTLSLQAALSRLLFSFARDDMIPGSASFKVLVNKTPRNAMIAACAAPLALAALVFFMPDSLPRITAFAVAGIYVAFQLVVLAALRQRLRGWRPAGQWSLGSWGMAVNVAALLYGIAAVGLLAWPGDAGLPLLDRWIVLIGLAAVIASGAVYMVVARPYEGSTAPEDDALEVAEQLRSARSVEVRDTVAH